MYKLENHHELVKKAVDFIKTEEVNTGGTLGNRKSVKHRAYLQLERYLKAFEGTLFVSDELKKAIDDIYKYPLKEYAKDSIGRQLKAGIDDENLASLVTTLREEDKLCIIKEDDSVNSQPQIICSLGLTNIL